MIAVVQKTAIQGVSIDSIGSNSMTADARYPNVSQCLWLCLAPNEQASRRVLSKPSLPISMFAGLHKAGGRWPWTGR